MRDNYRVQQVRDFVDETDWRGAGFTALRQDASRRSYYRLRGGPKPALIMDVPPEPSCDMIERYLALGPVFEQRGVRVPAVFVADPEQGILIVEDLGTQLLSVALQQQPRGQLALLRPALDVLIRLHKQPALATEALPCPYDDLAAMQTRLKLMLDWYFPWKGWEPSAEARAHFKHAWSEVLTELLAMPNFLQHRDYHVDNLLLVPDEAGRSCCAVLDFQDATQGSALFDLVSLLEDARVDIGAEARQTLWAHYLTTLPSAEQPAYQRNYAVAACLRHARVMAIFCRLAHHGKAHYLAHLPRVESYFFAHLLNSELLRPLRFWFETFEAEHGIRLQPASSVL